MGYTYAALTCLCSGHCLGLEGGRAAAWLQQAGTGDLLLEEVSTGVWDD